MHRFVFRRDKAWQKQRGETRQVQSMEDPLCHQRRLNPILCPHGLPKWFSGGRWKESCLSCWEVILVAVEDGLESMCLETGFRECRGCERMLG